MTMEKHYYVVGQARKTSSNRKTKDILFPIIKLGVKPENVNSDDLEAYRGVFNYIAQGLNQGEAESKAAEEKGVTITTIANKTRRVRYACTEQIEEAKKLNLDVSDIFGFDEPPTPEIDTVKAEEYLAIKSEAVSFLSQRSDLLSELEKEPTLEVMTLTLSQVIEGIENKFILPENFIPFKSASRLYPASKRYNDVIYNLSIGQNYYTAIDSAKVKNKNSWEGVQNSILMLREFLLTELQKVPESYRASITLDCLVMKDIYANTLLAYSVPNKKTGVSKRVLFPLLERGQKVRYMTNRKVDVYIQLLDKLKKGGYIGYSVFEVSNEAGISLTHFDSIIPRMKEILFVPLMQEAEKIVLASPYLKQEFVDVELADDTPVEPTTSEYVEKQPSGIDEETAKYIQGLLLEKEMYRKKCESLEAEIEWMKVSNQTKNKEMVK